MAVFNTFSHTAPSTAPVPFTTEVNDQLNLRVQERIEADGVKELARLTKEYSRKQELKKGKTVWKSIPLKATPTSKKFLIDFVGVSDDTPETVGKVNPTSTKQIKRRSVIEDTVNSVYNVVETSKAPYVDTWTQGYRFDRLFEALSTEDDIIELMQCSVDLVDLSYQFKFEELKKLDKYLALLYKNSDIETVVDSLIKYNYCKNRTTNNLRSIFKKNSKLLTQQCVDLNDFLRARYSDLAADNSHRGSLNFEIGFLNDIQQAAAGLNSATHSANRLFNKVDGMTEKIAKDTNDTINKISDHILEQVDSVVKNVKDFSPKALGFIDRLKEHNIIIVMHFIKLFSKNSFTDWCLSLGTILSMLGVNQMIQDKIFNIFKAPTLRFEGKETTTKLLALGSIMLGKYSPTKLVTDIPAFQIMREAKAIEDLYHLVEDIAKEYGIIDSPEAEIARMIKEDLSVCIKTSIEHTTRIQSTPSAYLYPHYIRLFRMDYDAFTDLRDNILKTSKNDPSVQAELGRLHIIYEKLHKEVINISRGDIIRQEPFAAVFVGKPGLGKTQVSSYLTKHGLAKWWRANKHRDPAFEHHLNFSEWSAWSESVNNDNKFADGYVGQEMHTIDDLFQSGLEGDHIRLINYVSMQKYILNCASLEAKGTPYTAKVLLASSNELPQHSKTIKSIEALHRRMAVVECTGTKLPKGSPFDSNFKHISFNVYPDMTAYFAKRDMKVMTMEELTEFVALGIRDKYNYWDSIIKQNLSEEISVHENLHIKNSEELDSYRRKFINNPANGLRDFEEILQHMGDFDQESYVDANGEMKWRHSGFRVDGTDDWTKHTRNSFFRLIKMPFQGTVQPLSEIISRFPAFKDPKLVMSHINWWLSTSPSGVLKKLCEMNLEYKDVNYAEWYIFKADKKNVIDNVTKQTKVVYENHQAYKFVRPDLRDQHKSPPMWTGQPSGRDTDASDDESDYSDASSQPSESDYESESDNDMSEEEEREFHDRERRWYERFFPKDSTFDNVYTYVCSRFEVCLEKFSHVINMLKTNMYNFVEYVKNTNIIEVILSYIMPVKDYIENNSSGIWSILRTTFFSSAFSFVFISLFTRVSEWMNGQSVCKNCDIPIIHQYRERCDIVKDYYCKENCKLGTFWNTHTDICNNIPELFKSTEPFLCCNKCNDCSHRNADKRSLKALFDIIASIDLYSALVFVESFPNYNDLFDFYDFEDSSQSMRRSKKKPVSIKSVFEELSVEDSANSYQQSRKKKCSFENSDQSMRASKKKPMKFEMTRGTPKRIQESELYDLEHAPEGFSAWVDSNWFKNDSLNFEATCSDATLLTMDAVMKTQVVCNRYKPGSSVPHTLYGFGYKNFIITPSHLWFNSEYKYSFIRGEDEISMQLVDRKTNRDIAVWSFVGNSFPTTLARHIPSRKEATDNLAISKLATTALNVNDRTYFTTVKCLELRNKSLVVNHQDRTFESLISVDGIKGKFVSAKDGDCGSPLLLQGERVRKKFIGFHIIGDHSTAYSALLDWETLTEMMDKKELRTEIKSDVYKLDFPSSICPVDIVDTGKLVGDRGAPSLVPSHSTQYIGPYVYTTIPATSTSIVKHELYGAFPETKKPAVLLDCDVEDKSKLKLNSAGDPSIMQTQFDKYSDPEPSVPGLDEHLKDMIEQFTDLMIQTIGDQDMSLMTQEEALSGIPELGIEAMNLDTTPGEPFSQFNKQALKKKHFCKRREDPVTKKYYYDIDTSTAHGKMAQDLIDQKWDLAKLGIRTLSPWKCCLKDETRPLEKVEVGKTRLFMAGPLDTTIIARRLFGKMLNAWIKSRLFHSVGIDCTGPEWTFLAESMLKKGSDFSDADFGSFDGRLRSDFMEAAGVVVINTICHKLVGKERDEIRTMCHVMWDEFIRTPTVAYKSMYLITHGNPSGNPMTTLVNCLVNFMYHWYCYRIITGKTALSSFDENIGFTCFGDDVLFCSNECITNYSFTNVAKIMRELGQDYTTAQKDGLDKDARKIHEVTFLKRNFIKAQYGNYYLAPIDTDSIEQQFNYSHALTTDFTTIKDQIKNAAHESARHGYTYFKYFKSTIENRICSDEDLKHHLIGCVTNWIDANEEVHSMAMGKTVM